MQVIVPGRGRWLLSCDAATAKAFAAEIGGDAVVVADEFEWIEWDEWSRMLA